MREGAAVASADGAGFARCRQMAASEGSAFPKGARLAGYCRSSQSGTTRCPITSTSHLSRASLLVHRRIDTNFRSTVLSNISKFPA